jgi:hypothetical protein
MKKLSILYFTILSFCSFAQKTEEHVIKIYLEDAETGKNIDDAKVTLEGFEIPALTAKYDKQEKVYYFTKIPAGYNTIMAYDKKYNEKGFQNIEGLPKELKLRLYDPLNVSYDFETYIHKNTYVEDPYKISVSTRSFLEYNLLKDYINQNIKDLKLQVELVNPYWEINKIEKIPYNTSQKEAYPLLNIKENQEVKTDYLFPLIGGVSTFFPDRSYSNKPKDICFILRKTDGSKFKRFNDPIIKKLKQQKIKVCSIVLNKKNGRDFTSNFKIRNKQNKKFNQKNKIDSSKVFFYDNNFRNERKSFGLLNFFKKDHYLQFDEPDKYPQLPSFVLISNERDETYNLFPETGKENPTTYKIPFPSECIGLGILDIYEYYSKAK